MYNRHSAEVDQKLMSDPAAASVLSQLSSREPIFHRSEYGTTRHDFAEMTTEDFWEVGASGRCYSKGYVLDELEKRHSQPQTETWETSSFLCKRLSPDVYLLTYTLLQDEVRITRRTTIWQHTAAGWKAVFHQGTVVLDEQ
ncbi:MAG: DUF4440 domain-containing protein [Acidobacteriota bacterium]|nr:DUF4440 domain-containing protein [Acidobacteriota bacterium]